MKYEYSPAELSWIRLACINGIGPGTFYRILAQFPDLEYFFTDTKANLKKLEKVIRPAAVQILRQNTSIEQFNDFMFELDKKNIQAVTLLNSDYPMYLKEIKIPPPVLYVKGTLKNISDRTLGIVGTRHCTRRGYELAGDVAKELAQNNVAVISGMARGIDTAAHNGALAANGVTVAVLGCGVDIIYPKENEKIYYEIMQKGAVISEYLPGIEPFPANFPARNRIISGISKGVYVVESSNKGGACITVGYAVAQGRDVFASAGSAFSPVSEFTNALCESGCPMVCSAQVILSEYGWGKAGKNDNLFGFNNIQLDFLEQQIYNLLLTGDMTAEELSESLEIPQSGLNITVTMMELNGLIKRLPGLLYTVR